MTTDRALRIGMIGTRGVPARYGGFETAVEEVGSRLVQRGHVVVVYCRNAGQSMESYKGMNLVNLPALRRRSLETLSHTGLSVVHAIGRSRPDVTFVFNAASAPYLPLLRAAGIPTAVHVDGIEWKRAKWDGLGRHYYRWAERSCARSGHKLIADSRGIVRHLSETYGVESVYIPYGAPITHPGSNRLHEVGVESANYHLVVARFEPENHVLEIVQGYVDSAATAPLVVVGASAYGVAYSNRIGTIGAGDSRVRLVGGIFDQELLDQLYSGALTYLHGHSVGGTNPSLLRAMGAGTHVVAYDVEFNREVVSDYGSFFLESQQVSALLLEAEAERDDWRATGAAGRESVLSRYRWEDVTDSYEQLALELSAAGRICR